MQGTSFPGVPSSQQAFHGQRCTSIVVSWAINFVATQEFSRSYNNSSSGVNLTPYSGVIFGGSYFNSKKEFKELFFSSKNTPDIEELK